MSEFEDVALMPKEDDEVILPGGQVRYHVMRPPVLSVKTVARMVVARRESTWRNEAGVCVTGADIVAMDHAVWTDLVKTACRVVPAELVPPSTATLAECFAGEARRG